MGIAANGRSLVGLSHFTENETINDKILDEHTRQIMDYAAILIKVAEAEIKRVTNETEDTDS